MKSQVISAIKWTAIAQVSSQLLSWLVTLVVIRLLQPSDYGLLAMATIFLGLLMIFADLGIATALVQRPQISTGDIMQASGLVVALHGVLGAGLALSAPVIAAFFSEPELAPVVRVTAVQLFVSAFGIVPDAMLQREMQFRRLAALDMVSAVTGSVSTLLMALAGAGVWALVLGTLASVCVKAAGVNVLCGMVIRPAFSLSGSRALLTVSTQAAMSRIIWFVYTQADAFIAGKWLGKSALGLYSVSLHLASLPNQRIAGLVNRIAFPAFARIQGSTEKVTGAVLFGVRMLSIVAFPVLWGLTVIAPELVQVVMGERWIEATMPLQIVSLIMPLRLISNFVPNAVRGIGRFDVELKTTLFSSLVMISAFLIGVQWGLFGLCLAWLGASPVVFAVNMHLYAKALELPLSRLLTPMLPAAGSATMMGLSVVAVRPVLVDLASAARLGVLVAVGAAAYVAATLMINRKGFREICDLLKAISGSRSGS